MSLARRCRFLKRSDIKGDYMRANVLTAAGEVHRTGNGVISVD